MTFFFTLEYLTREWKCLEVEAANFEEACNTYRQLREEGEPGKVVDSDTEDGDLVEVEDQKGTSYDPQEADKLACTEE
jgi:hypothetical protein